MKDLYKINTLLFLLCALLLSCTKEHEAQVDNDTKTDTARYFFNPIKNNSPDPYITRKDGFYYYMNSGPNYLILTRAKELIYLGNAYSKTIYVPEKNSPYSAHVSRPELHFLNNKWYIYFSGDNGADINRRIYVLENSSADPYLGEWVMKGKVADAAADLIATDGTVLEYNGNLYFLWSGVDETPTSQFLLKQNLYIAKMKDPYTLDGSRVKIAEPTADWEKATYKREINSVIYTYTVQLNQNPQPIKNASNQVFVAYTGGSCEGDETADNLAIGLLTLKKDSDPMIAANWIKTDGPVFAKNPQGVFSPGFNSFFKSADDKEDWMVYDANAAALAGCGVVRSARMQKISWKADGAPDLGSPIGIRDSIQRPSK